MRKVTSCQMSWLPPPHPDVRPALSLTVTLTPPPLLAHTDRSWRHACSTRTYTIHD